MVSPRLNRGSLRHHTWLLFDHGVSSFQLDKTFGHVASGLAGEALWSLFLSGLGIFSMEVLFVPTGAVALAEIGDKTQLLAFILAARFKKPVPIIARILVAKLINHGLAGGQTSLADFTQD